jgi:hypothetical protein
MQKINRVKEFTNELAGTNETITKQDKDSKRLYQILQKFAGDKGYRNRRALLPFVWKVSKHLFGTMDEEEGN